ncbi:MAG: formylglycine-generating enzyme family protein [Fibromonadaceae bacterium]|jgi:hypothetical protein|nr:formylglycine-generating enzyme family protein [Fibromonadaceae bacterium]
MKTFLSLLLVLSLFAFASEKYGVYDLQGNRVSTFEAKPHELPEKTQQIKNDNPYRRLYVSSIQKGKSSKPLFRYRYKTETGAYIEASRKEAFSVCPDKEAQGTWISEYSVALNEENCLIVQAPNLAGTFRILFMENSGRTDTIQVLVEQSYVLMDDYSHKIWTTDLDYEDVTYMDDLLYGTWGSWEDIFNRHGRYESRSYSQPVIVDKTKLTMGDALYYDRNSDKILSPFTLEKEEYKNRKLEGSGLPLIDVNPYSEWRFANERSKKEGLDTAYITIHPHSKDAKKFILLGNPAYGSCEVCTMLALDTTASGYRSAFEEEWMLLMRAGASTRYYWGDKDDSSTVSRYEWIRPIGLKPVAKRLPNGFGLYDMAGIADEYVISNFYKKYLNLGLPCSENLSPECTLINAIGAQEEYIEPSYTECMLSSDAKEWKNLSDGKCITKRQETRTKRAYYKSLRLIRKTPKLHKLDKF